MIEKNTLESRKKLSFDIKPLVAFFVTLISLFVIFTIAMVAPFGERSIFTSDLGAQYGPYLVGLRDALKSGQSLYYSQYLGMGQNAMGVFAYYLSSPLNFIVLLFPRSWLTRGITIMICTKLAFAGAFMTWLLDRKFTQKSKMSVIFGMMYPLCSFALVFFFHIMWLDGFMLLPLVIVLTESYIKDRKKWPVLTITLFVLFVSGYYMAYMVGIFSFLYLVSIMVYQGKLKENVQKEGLKTIGTFILSAVTAAFMSACILVPAALDTLGNGDYTKPESLTMNPNFTIVGFFDQFLNTGVSSISDNKPFIFCGLAALFLFILFFFIPKIEKKLKIGVAAASVFAFVSFQMPMLNRGWHLFDEPNWFNFRYSYLFSFIMIMVAYYAFLNLKSVPTKYFFISWGIIVMICAISQGFGEMQKPENTFFATILISFLICILCYGVTLDTWPDEIRNLKRFGAAFLAIVILVEIVVLNPRIYLPGVLSGSFDEPEFVDTLDKLEELSKKEDTSTWSRTELHYCFHMDLTSNTLSIYMGHPGISIFASMANKKTNHFLKQLGYCSNYNYFALDHTCFNPIADSVLGIRYLVSAEHTVKDLAYYANVDKYYLYENENAMPISMLVDANAYSFDGFALEKDEHEKDYFAFQENWLTSLSGLDASDIYETWNEEWEVINGEQTDIRPKQGLNEGYTVENSLNHENRFSESKDINYYLRNNMKSPMVLRTTITPDRDGDIYLLIPFPFLQSVGGIFVNGQGIYMMDSNSYYSLILNLGAFKAGETYTIDIRITDEIFGSYDPIFAYCNTENIAPHKEAMSAGISNVKVENGKVDVTATCEEDKIILFSIPYEKGWTAKVDGQTVELIAYQDAFLSIPLSAGTHQIELRFTPPGWNLGLAMSAVGLVMFLAFTFLMRKNKKQAQPVEATNSDNNKLEEA